MSKNSNIYTLIKDEADFVSRMNAYIESLKIKIIIQNLMKKMKKFHYGILLLNLLSIIIFTF